MTVDLRHYQMKHQVTYFECDETGQLKLSMAFALAVLVSEKHDEAVQEASGTRPHSDQAWVITNYQARFAPQQPTNEEIILLETEYTAANRFFAQRTYWLKSLTGQLYATIKTQCVLLSLTKRKMVPINQEYFQRYQLEPTNQLPKLDQPLKMADGQAVTAAEYRVRYFDLDSNRHVNNARYFDWLLDPLGADFLLHHQVATVAIRYRREVRYPNMVTSQWTAAPTTSGHLTTVHQIKVGETVNVSASFTWQKK
ncbi:acyl-ACP thioesterase domain-containing protein [uncultured Limosilactobacillus sp.]|uniref:acyl-[acyl-carrier-protein] thioesterase n=1 Tax=uncultured Limosilactobacillus sp. TaxID=2837629 RepID=UPI0025D77023|nr:acyl-ACP thioesterase domain-containing protein [uncultured Limosilactobacillus sp.]